MAFRPTEGTVSTSRLILVPLLAAILIAGCSTADRRTGDAPGDPSPARVSTDWLAERLGERNLVVLDARSDAGAFVAGHLPGAVHLSVASLEVPPAVLLGVLERYGIAPHDHIVVYADRADADAAGMARLLRDAGLPRVSVLDGGLDRWSREGRPVAGGLAWLVGGAGTPEAGPSL